MHEAARIPRRANQSQSVTRSFHALADRFLNWGRWFSYCTGSVPRVGIGGDGGGLADHRDADGLVTARRRGEAMDLARKARTARAGLGWTM